MLDVHREGVTVAAMRLQDVGFNRYARGDHISILDRKAWRRAASTYYAVVKLEYDRLLPSRLAS